MLRYHVHRFLQPCSRFVAKTSRSRVYRPGSGSPSCWSGGIRAADMEGSRRNLHSGPAQSAHCTPHSGHLSRRGCRADLLRQRGRTPIYNGAGMHRDPLGREIRISQNALTRSSGGKSPYASRTSRIRAAEARSSTPKRTSSRRARPTLAAPPPPPSTMTSSRAGSSTASGWRASGSRRR